MPRSAMMAIAVHVPVVLLEAVGLPAGVPMEVAAAGFLVMGVMETAILVVGYPS